MNGAADKEAERRVLGLSATERLLTPMALMEERSPHLWARKLPPIEDRGESPALQRYLFVAPFPETQPKVARLGIFGAIHGDEIEGPLALGQFLSGLAATPQAPSGFFLHLYPICNPGQTLAVLLDATGARNVPDSAAKDGHRIVSVTPEGTDTRLIIRKGEA